MKTLLTFVLLFSTLVSLSALSFTQSHHLAEKNTFHLANTEELTLSLDAAARDQSRTPGYGTFPLSTSILNIYWNDVLVSSWNAPDYKVHHLQFKVTPKNGSNTLSFSYPNSNFGGSCFSNVSLKGVDGKELVVNGNFTANLGGSSYLYFSQTNVLQGWASLKKFGVGLSSLYNPRFSSNFLVALDNQSPSLYQTFDIDTEQQDQENTTKLNPRQKLTLSLDVAARDKPHSLALNASWLHIFWNGVLIEDWRTTDYNIYHLTFKVKPIDGLNTLLFSTPSSMEGGCVFNNVSLTRAQDQKELVVNGHFENLVFKNGVWNDYNVRDTIVGWRTFNAFAVGSKTFNNRFTSNLVTLDNNHPTLYQTFKFKVDDPSAN